MDSTRRTGGRAGCVIVVIVLLSGALSPLIEGGITKSTGSGQPSVAVVLPSPGENSSATLALPNNSLVLNAKMDINGRKYREEVSEAVEDRDGFLRANLTNISVGYDSAMLRSVPFLPADTPWDFFTGRRNATGAAAGDLNGDGAQDLAVCYMEDGVAGLFPGRGDGTFRALEDYELGAGSRPVAVAAGDLNGDGLTDLAAADQSLKAVWVLAQNAATHRLDAPVRYAVGASLTDIALGDFNSDGLLDVAVASYSPCCVTVLAQSPSTHLLSSPAGYPLGSAQASSIAAADIDGDSRTDILAASPDGTLYFLKQSAGGFNAPAAYTVDSGYTAGAVAAGDVNGTWAGVEALVSCANSTHQGYQLFYGSGGALAKGPLVKFPADMVNQPPMALGADDFDGDGQAEAAVGLNSRSRSEIAVVDRTGAVSRTPFVSPARELCGADLDGDGRRDLAAACPLRNSLALLRQNTTGALLDFEELRFTPSAVAVGDLNRDGRPDIAVSSRYTARVGYRLGAGAGQYGGLLSAGPVNDPAALGIADLDGDGLDDLAVLCRGNDTLAVASQGAGGLKAPLYHQTGHLPSALALGDVTGDGLADAVVAQAGEGYISVLSQSSGGLSADEDYMVGAGASALELADLDSDGRTDVAVCVRETGTVQVLHQTPGGKLGTPAVYDAGTDPVGVSAGDFDMDRRPDLVVATAAPPSLRFLFQNSSGGLDASESLALGSRPLGVRFAEVDRDGLPEVWLLCADGNLSMYRSDSYGGLLPAQNYTTGADPGAAALEDIDGNGLTDIVLAQGSGNVFALVPQDLQNGKARTVSSMDAPVLLQKADLNRDGLLDMLVAGQSEIWAYYQTPGGGFSAPVVRTWTTFQMYNYVAGLAAGDLNSDGWPDVAVTGSYMFTASVFYNGPSGLAASKVDVNFGSTAYCYGGLVIADLTGDGLPDLGRTNYYGQVNIAAQTSSGGLAAPTSVSLGGYYPNGMIAGDFNRDGRTDLLVGSAWNSRVTVLLGAPSGSFDTTVYSTSGNGGWYNIPLAISDLNGDGRTDFAVLCSTPKVVDVFLQNADGTFADRTSLPVSNSDSTGSGMDAGDIDGDGRSELVVSNSGSGNLTLFDQDGSGALFEMGSYTAGATPRGVAVADLNSDGAGDIVVADSSDDRLAIYYQVARQGRLDLPPVVIPGGFLDSVVMTWNRTPPAPGCTLSASVSLDGSNWTRMTNGTQVAFTNVSRTLYRRIDMGASSNGPLGVYDIHTTYVHSSFPTNPYLDVGADGSWEWTLGGNFSTKVTVSGGGLVQALNRYLQANRAQPGPLLQVPLALGSSTEGVLEVTNISVEYDEPPHLIRPIPEGLAIDEDTADNELLDLLSIFADDYDRELSYELLDLVNGTFVNVTIVENAFLSVDAASWERSRDWSGELSFRIRATDTRGLSNTTGLITVLVRPVNDPPVITSSPPLNAMVGAPYEYTVTARDVEGAPLTFLLDKGPPGMTLDPRTGRLSWFPGTDAPAPGPVEVAICAYDGEVYSAAQVFAISLSANLPPVVRGIPPTTVNAGEELVYRLNASDPENATLAFVLAAGPAGMALGADGVLTWRPSAAQAGFHDVQLSVTDGWNTVIQNFRLEVVLRPAENRRPEITSLPVLNATVNRTYTYQVQASDADGDRLGYSLEPAPAGMTIDNATGLISWTPREWQAGNHTVVVRASDGKASAAQLFVIHVEPDRTPVAPSPENITVRAGTAWFIALVIISAGVVASAVLLWQARRKWPAPGGGVKRAAGPAPPSRGPELPRLEMIAAPPAGAAAAKAAGPAAIAPAPPKAPPPKAVPPPEDFPEAEPWEGEEMLPEVEPVPAAAPRVAPSELARLVRAPERPAPPPETPARGDQIDEIFKLLGETKPAAPAPAAPGPAAAPAPRPPPTPVPAPRAAPPPPPPPAAPRPPPARPGNDLNRTLEELVKMKK